MTATITNLPSLYDPFTTEAKWQKFWEENQIYKADPNKGGEPYCVVIPPPNVTGSLHMGHAFESALIDTLVRYHRMQGRNTLWLPGTDHASIAVHTILEKQLKAEGKTRQELGREKFLERSWQWKAESGGTIVNQLRRLGVSVDWSRERFTLDEGLSKAVAEAFVSLYDEGLIYRGEYLVNWCPATQSAVSDVEVESKEVEGNLWHFRYPLTDGSGYVEVATTRPETMLGDTAVAVNPNDDRYKHLIGKTLTLPITQQEIPIISDELVDPAFGTGCVKVTPAHDLNDFEMGKRHNLPFINILNKDGTLNANGGEFAGQDRFVARKNVVSRLETDGFLVKIEDYKHTVPYSDRGKVPVEPLLSTQWFVKIRPLADKSLAFLDEKNSPEFVPQRWTKVYRDWLVNLRDWCISRQLWWGHQIPAWYAVSETNGQITDNTPFVVAKSTNEAWEKAKSQFGENVQLEQDPDVLDTWFSSGLWPFSTLGWPEQTPDLAKYYPTTTLVTGFDIIFFWVARMTMMAGHFTGQMPFQTVYIHGLVRDENNKKMSKSANNGIDPLLLIDKYGTDALRYTLVREVAGAGQDIRLEYDRKKDESPSVEASRNFANKLWNAARFVMMNLDGLSTGDLGLGTGNSQSLELSDGVPPSLADRWIISRYHQVIKQTTHYIDNYGLGEAAKGIYEFIWGDFCDWYIELVKSRLQKDADPLSRKAAQQTLAYVLEGILKLLHPFMPHITEEIWQTLTQQPEDSPQTLALQAYPQADVNLINPALETQFDLLIGTIRTIRNLRAEAEVKPGAKIIANLQTDSESERQILMAGQSYIKDLAKVETLTIAAGQQPSTVTKKKPQKGLKTIGLVIAGLVFLRVALAVADTVDNVPFLGTFFEIVGLGYSAWFVTRNLLSTPARKRFLAKFFAPPTEKNLSGTVQQAPEAAEKSIAGVVGTVQVVIPLAGVVDIETLRAKLERSISKAETEAQSLKGRLSNPKFVDKAPADVVQAARDALAEAEKQVEILRLRLQTLV
ncbi:valine--tRNA ligase [Anabaena sp. FACHB-709]|uniref:Valine--tRNA ligase n=3 Tax=Nostocaceae TaxID=1162 RepID=SYV_NOSS1|nr:MULTISPECIES: valine--tRNA ligase [Nostocaceae]Q8YX97.1 RecName: Full=Valine--tRNA ligase; AltName: Full=Valyl-tRNA synthetase; Short=ValRS [Nostoc sp. PCC 7120 = FACHB-418]BAY72295.1 valyl-tRNA synthetase [Trichormus variabilis NIES-23]HBW29439.1 valine--tRNA ligase [Nostoc sp. UBA8866]MBD2170684.1 valine--tRNA ligase [Anabaena cylindrica FACHB-318]MBD2262470.1 valine--tRNA ligase [Anabaena sp. FACHB-709]MBD2272017.1 valine--tRNA ligase [Nostoc sp. PCC 7120 = FACHB-418]